MNKLFFSFLCSSIIIILSIDVFATSLHNNDSAVSDSTQMPYIPLLSNDIIELDTTQLSMRPIVLDDPNDDYAVPSKSWDINALLKPIKPFYLGQPETRILSNNRPVLRLSIDGADVENK